MAPRTQKKEYRTSVILSEDQHLRLKALADKDDASIAWVIRKAIEAYILATTQKQDKK
ncbi:MAG: CopG family transcriptional regulator [Holosporales bacterium]